MARQPTLEFWYEFASTYAYLAAARIEGAAAAAGVAVRWRPFLLGPIFASQGWTTSPFNLYPAKGRAMWRDVERTAAGQGLPPLTRPDPFPVNSLSAVRVAVLGQDQDWLVPFSKAVFSASFAAGLTQPRASEPTVKVSGSRSTAGMRSWSRSISPSLLQKMWTLHFSRRHCLS